MAHRADNTAIAKIEKQFLKIVLYIYIYIYIYISLRLEIITRRRGVRHSDPTYPRIVAHLYAEII